jgi:hypothetical protein
MSVQSVPTIRRMPPEVSWLVTGALLGLIVWGIAVAVDRTQLNTSETVDALSSGYVGPRIAGIDYDVVRVAEQSEDGEASTLISLAGWLPDTRRGPGAPTLIYYRVFDTPDAARAAYYKLRRESFFWKSQSLPVHQPIVRDVEGLRSSTFCVERGDKWCYFVAGATLVEVDSRLPSLGLSGGYRMRALIGGAMANYEALTAGR